MRTLNTLFTILAMFFCIYLQAQNLYYVATNGNDGNLGTFSQPWLTISKANTTLDAGDTVFIRGGTYHDVIVPSNSGVLGSPMVYIGYPGETVIIDGKDNLDYTVYTNWKSYITLYGLTFKNQYYLTKTNQYYWVQLVGDYLTMKFCSVIADGNPVTNFQNGMLSRGVETWGTYILVEDCYIRGVNQGLVVDGPTSRHFTARRDTIKTTVFCNIIVCAPSDLTYGIQSNLIEYCLLDSSYAEDNIQFQPWYYTYPLTISYANNCGNVVQYNTMRNAQENAMDFKACRDVLVQYNDIHSSNGDDNGNGVCSWESWAGDTDGGAGFAKGTGDSTIFVIVRYNNIYDHRLGSRMWDGWHVYNNNYLNNARDWQGPNQTDDTGLDNYQGIATWNMPNEKRTFINNILSNNRNGQACWELANGGNFDMDANLYNDATGQATVRHKIGSTIYTSTIPQWKNFLATNGAYSYMLGKDVNSIEGDPQFVDAPAYDIVPATTNKVWDFQLQSSSPAIDAGRALTYATNSGTSSASLVVEDARYFMNGYGVIQGDLIRIGTLLSDTVRITAINYQTNTLTLQSPLNWSVNTPVTLDYIGNAPDIGANEYTPTSNTPVAGNNGPVCVGTTLSLTSSTIPGATYSWTGPNGFTSTQQNPTVSTNVSLIMAGIYSVVATVGGNTGSPGMTTVVVNPVPSAPTAGNNGLVNAGSVLSLTASTVSGATYSWTGPNGFTSTAQNPTVSNYVSLSMSGIYSVTATVNGCTSAASPTTVVVNASCGTITIDATSTKEAQSGFSAFSWSHTTAGSNRYILFVTQTWEHLHSANITSLTYSGAPATFLGSQHFDGSNLYGRIEFWGLVAPAIGNNTINVTLAGTAGDFSAVAISFNNVDSSAPVSSFKGIEGTGSSATLYIPSIASELVVDALVSWQRTYTHGLNQTLVVGLDNTVAMNDIFCSIKTTSSDSTEMSWTLSSSNEWGLAGITLKPYISQAPTAGNNGPVCAGSPLSLTASTVSGATYSWTGPNGFTSTQQNPIVSGSATIAMTGTYSVTASVNGCSSSSAATTLTVNPLPLTPTITQNGNDLLSSSTSGNQWYNTNGAILGATSFVFTPTQDGYYYVIVLQNGCESTSSNIISVLTSGIENTINTKSFNLYPNPNDGVFTLTLIGYDKMVIDLKIVDIIGKVVYSEKFGVEGSEYKKGIDIQSLSSGIYYLKFSEKGSFINLKIDKN